MPNLDFEAMQPDQSRAHMATIWDALHSYRESLIPEGIPEYDAQWQDIIFAMDEIRSALELPEAEIGECAAEFAQCQQKGDSDTI